MKKYFLFLMIFFAKVINAQSYIGFLSDNYSGVHAVINNPANLADSRYKADINLFSISGAGFNDAYKTNVFNKINEDFNKDAEKTFKTDNQATLNLDMLGPSFLINVNKKNAFALSTRLRAFISAANIDGELYNKFDQQTDLTTENISATNQNYNFTVNNWAELGLSYAFVLLDKEDHFIKGGLTAKYLHGLANAYFKTNNVNVNYTDLNNSLASNYVFSGNIEVANANNINDTKLNNFESTGIGFGGDLGIVYEFRPSSVNAQSDLDSQYRLKFGLSITDIGSIKYRDAEFSTFDLNRDINGLGNNGNLSQQQLEELNFDQLFNETNRAKSITAALPTAVHFNLDWNINQRFYLNFNSDYGIITKDRVNGNFVNNLVSLTPRYERKWFSAYLPLTYTEISGFQSGFGFRAGPLFLGSGSIISNLITKTGFADVYAGLKIPLFKRAKKYEEPEKIEPPKPAEPVAEKKIEKDSDGDGVVDNYDKCPTEPGERDNKGCPWPDKDKDGTPDKDDSCVNVAGPKENKGCPWKDSDGDKVLDKDDKCPDVPGLVENEGCPKINNDVVKKLNTYSKLVLFDNGKSTIKQESYKNLDEMAELMKDYPTAKFNIEGHTDSSGKPATNLKLSGDRAKAIKDYLTNKGIEANRLSSKGFGSKIPVASNKTAKGKALNRRVEIKLAN